jgi:hypothetical protein
MFIVTGFNGNGITHKSKPSLQASLFANSQYQAFPQVLLRMWHGDRTHLGWVDKLMVAAAGTLQAPTIGLQQLDQFATLHDVYYTHHRILRPMSALRQADQGNECLKLADTRRPHTHSLAAGARGGHLMLGYAH